jgi:hypothetical protein
LQAEDSQPEPSHRLPRFLLLVVISFIVMVRGL